MVPVIFVNNNVIQNVSSFDIVLACIRCHFSSIKPFVYSIKTQHLTTIILYLLTL